MQQIYVAMQAHVNVPASALTTATDASHAGEKKGRFGFGKKNKQRPTKSPQPQLPTWNPLAVGWAKKESKQYASKFFYCNAVSGETRWEEPVATMSGELEPESVSIATEFEF